jgi:putative transposase
MFRNRADYRLFLDVTRTSAMKFDVEVHGYALMTNHIHFIATPSSPSGLPRMMQRIGRIYVRPFNVRGGRTGSLWEGRYKASLIEDERYWLTCLRYIELNPVRAGLTTRSDLYEWSSFAAHAFGRPDPLLTPHRLFLAGGSTAAERQAWWRATCDAPIDEEALTRIRRAVHCGHPLKQEDNEALPLGTAAALPLIPAPDFGP